MDEINLNKYLSAYRDDFQYAMDCHLMLNWYPERIKDLTPTGGSLLELGIGHGYASAMLSEKFSRHLIIEGSSEIIRQFKDKQDGIEGMEIIHGFFEEFETNERFDVIVMGFVLEHVDDDDRVFGHISGFLKPGGRIFVAVPNGQALHRRFALNAGMIKDYFELGEGDVAMGHKRVFTVETLRALVERHGFKISRMEGIYLKPFTTAQIERLDLPRKILNAMMDVGKEYPELCSGILAEVIGNS